MQTLVFYWITLCYMCW